MQNTEAPPFNWFNIEFRGCNPLEAENTEYVILVKSRRTSEQAVANLKLMKSSPA